MTQYRYNIAIVGKSGVGKSAFINYLFQTHKAKTGAGRPVTEKGFHPYDIDINSLPVRIYDSWGLEADKADQWIAELNTELQKRGTDTSPQHWFHTVFYCINAGGHKVESFDSKVIKKFLDHKNRVTVIFTKADLISESDLEEMTRVIREDVDESIPVIPVCSEDKVLLSGRKVTPFGRVNVFTQVALAHWNTIKVSGRQIT